MIFLVLLLCWFFLVDFFFFFPKCTFTKLTAPRAPRLLWLSFCLECANRIADEIIDMSILETSIFLFLGKIEYPLIHCFYQMGSTAVIPLCFWKQYLSQSLLQLTSYFPSDLNLSLMCSVGVLTTQTDKLWLQLLHGCQGPALQQAGSWFSLFPLKAQDFLRME